MEDREKEAARAKKMGRKAPEEDVKEIPYYFEDGQLSLERKNLHYELLENQCCGISFCDMFQMLVHATMASTNCKQC